MRRKKVSLYVRYKIINNIYWWLSDETTESSLGALWRKGEQRASTNEPIHT